MKKGIAILLTATVVLAMSACGNQANAGNQGTASQTTASSYKTGLGIVAEMSGANVETGHAGKTQADVTACEATFDASGKIVAVSFDCMQCKASVDESGAVTVADAVSTKKELGDKYGMVAYSNPKAVAEWDKQTAAFEQYCIGKTVDEVNGIALTTNSTNEPGTPAVEDLKTTCTITVTEFQKALAKAYANAVGENAAYSNAGLGMSATMAGTNSINGNDGITQADVTACAVALDKDGKIAAISFDCIQCKATVTSKGAVAVSEEISTKKELGDKYGMAAYSNPKAVAEWDQQAAAFEQYCIGKTPSDIAAMSLTANPSGEKGTPATEDLKSSCTITVTEFQKALAKAVANAK